MQGNVRPTAEIFIAVIAGLQDPVSACRLDGFAIGAGRYRDKTGTTLCALYRRGYE